MPGEQSYLDAAGNLVVPIASNRLADTIFAGGSAQAFAAGSPFTGGVSTATATGGEVASAFPWGLAITAGFMLYGLLGRPNGKDRRSKGFAFQFRENPTDPNEPIALVYGAPIWTPPVLFRYLTSPSLNSHTPAEGQRFVTCLSLGGGPIDGRDFRLWMDDREILAKYTTDDPVATRTLSPTDSTNTVYSFPTENVAPASVVIYKDGVVSSVGGDTAGSIADSIETQITSSKAAAVTFSVIDDPDIGTSGLRYGCRLPLEGLVTDLTAVVATKPGFGPTSRVTIGATTIAAGGTATFTMAGTASIAAALHVGRTKDGRQYVWVDASKNGASISHFLLTYRVKPTIKIEQRKGQWVAVFTSAQTAAITATWDQSVLGDKVKTSFRPGTADQDPLPVDGVKQANAIGAELTIAGGAYTYTSPADVDDVELVFESGPAGLYDHKQSGSGACQYLSEKRQIQVLVKANTASSRPATGNDPATGWVNLKHPRADGDGVTLISSSQGGVGTQRWFFSVADLLAYAQGKNPGLTTGHSLPTREKYDIQVLAADDPESSDPSIAEDIFLAAAQDVRRIRMNLPHHATVTVEVTDLAEIPAEPVFRVQMAGRMVWVPDSDAVYSATTLRPEPGSFQWSRNPVWIACDVVTDPVFGGGRWYGWQNIDLTLAIAAAAFCDATDAASGEVRAQYDGAMRSRASLWDHVSQVCAGARILPAMSGGTWRFLIDQDASAVMAVTEADFALRSVSLQLPGPEEVPTDLEAAFTDEAQDFELSTEYRSLPSEPSQRVTRRVDLTGVRRRTQAGRAVELALRQFDLQRRTVRLLAASWRLLVLEAGDIVTLTATTTGDSTAKYRVVSTSWGPGFLPALELAEHNPACYGALVVQGAPTTNRLPPSGGGTTTNTGVAPTQPYVQSVVQSDAVVRIRKVQRVT